MRTGWKGDLTPLLERISRVATGSGSLRVISGGARLALALPADRRAAMVVANLYQPQRLKGKAFLTLVKGAITSGLVKWIPAYQVISTTAPQVEWLNQAAANGSVGFLGCNPNHGLRCVLAGIDPGNGTMFIAKLGFDESAVAVRREAEVLESLSAKFPGIVRPMGFECESTTRGRETDKIPGNSHFTQPSPGSQSSCDWALLRLPHLGTESPQSMADPRIKCLLDQWLGEQTNVLGDMPSTAALIARVPLQAAPTGWHQRMKSMRIRSALLHGDFAVWNLRLTERGLVAIDWEWGQENAVAGVDLAHGLRQECYMARGMKPTKAVPWMLAQAKSPAWRDYLKLCGWESAPEDWLRLGLLHSHFNALNPSADLLAVLDIHLNA